jgi:TatD DNase family protein
MWIDAHCHINCFSHIQVERWHNFSKDYSFIDSSTNYKSSLISLELSREFPFIYSSLGFHPFWTKEFSPQTIEDYERLIDSNKKIVAIGEVGLDFKAEAPLQKQEDIFGRFIELAKTKDLPLLVHNRLNSFYILEVLNRFFSSYKKVIFHCFSYSPDLLAMILEKEGYVSFSLNLLRKKEKVLNSLKMCPLEHILLETDSPYMKIKNRDSTPLDIKEVYSFVAGVKGIEEKKLREMVLANVRGVFSLKD